MVSNVSEAVTEPVEGSSRRPPVIGLTTYLEQAKQGVWDVRAAFQTPCLACSR